MFHVSNWCLSLMLCLTTLLTCWIHSSKSTQWLLVDSAGKSATEKSQHGKDKRNAKVTASAVVDFHFFRESSTTLPTNLWTVRRVRSIWTSVDHKSGIFKQKWWNLTSSDKTVQQFLGWSVSGFTNDLQVKIVKNRKNNQEQRPTSSLQQALCQQHTLFQQRTKNYWFCNRE